MDEMVERAMTRWPDVPDCYGWLRLDARGLDLNPIRRGRKEPLDPERSPLGVGKCATFIPAGIPQNVNSWRWVVHRICLP